MLFHAAAVVGTGVLAGRAVDTASFEVAALQQGDALQRQLQSTLLVSSRDATAAALAAPALVRLAVASFQAATHAAGINLAGGGISVRLSEREEAAAGSLVQDSDSPRGESQGGEAVGSAAAPSDDDDGGSAGGTGWLSSLLQLCSSPAAAELLGAAANQLVHSGVATRVTLRSSFSHLREKLRKAGVEVFVDANAACLSHAVAKLGGGDAERGHQLKAAIDSWQQGLEALGAGPVPGLMSVWRSADLETWRSKVELGWPGAAAVFEAALAEGGPSLMQLAGRWTDSKKKQPPWAGSNPSAALKEQLNPRKRRSSLI